MKTGKKVMILLLVFAAAAMVYFVHPVGKKEEHGVTEYTAMEKAKFPVLYATMGEREMAPVFGQTDERGVTAGRDSDPASGGPETKDPVCRDYEDPGSAL